MRLDNATAPKVPCVRGSPRAPRDKKAMNRRYQALREKLRREGVLVDHGSNQIRLTRTHIFDSPSSAASVLSGGSKNGRTEWKDTAGRTLRDNQMDTADEPPATPSTSHRLDI